MTIQITDQGFTKDSLTVKNTNIANRLREIYGSNINLDPNTPLRNLVEIFSLATDDIEEKFVTLQNIFNPNTATGIALENLANISNVQRKNGFFTTQIVRVITNKILTLSGLEDNYLNPDATAFGVKDSFGNVFYLINNSTLQIGNNDLLFRASTYGSITTQVGTITQPIQVVDGIVSVTNTQVQSSIGSVEESDLELRLRRERSLFKNAYNIEEAIYSALLNDVDSVSDARIFINRDLSLTVNGVPPRHIWAIVEGGTNNEVANVLDRYRAYNPLYGNISVTIVRPEIIIIKNSNTIIKPEEAINIKFSRPTAESIKIKFDIKPLRSNYTFPSLSIKEYVVKNFKVQIGSIVDQATVMDLIQTAIVLNGGGSTPSTVLMSKDNGLTWFPFLTPTNFDNKFSLSIDDIIVNELNY
jgi:uncharacterized phage protein gp47/JayE